MLDNLEVQSKARVPAGPSNRWLEDIPERWGIIRSRRAFEERKGRAPINSRQLTASQKYGMIFQDRYMELEGRKVTQVVLNNDILKWVQEGDFVMSMRSFQGGLEYSAFSGSCSSAYISLKPTVKLNSRFFRWLFKSDRYIEALRSTSNLVRDGQALRYDNFCQVDLPDIDLREQEYLADLLDDKTEKIDRAIAIKEAQIARLEERKQILIQTAVTRGLDPNVPMKDSGVDWIGEIPAHWSLTPLTRDVFIQEGPGIMAVDFHETGVPLIRISGVKTSIVSLAGCNYLAPRKVKRKWGHFRLRKGDLVISGSASTGLIAEVGDDAIDAILYTGLIRVLNKNPRKLQKDFLKVFLGSDLFFTQIDLQKTGSTISHYGPSHLGRMKILLPPLHEQVKISKFVEMTVQENDQVLRNIHEQIQHLEEYRASLINTAVTGKIKVPSNG